ncbi:endolytic transglycosylase MltG [Solemya velum gill symbiont]|uniref:endolytic transglycosylase MltG n=1 Tax=Solemya velum gill symbiont TaxID=2340 RepID=UPI000996EC8D|nr:endolytic transglycosylase MltG [Solemya velum gill symbiont]OOZ00134.1 aminodeoxychorismate lyase [Solemya velum gill symbiont]OOZ02294.1 aminodeoxychorismate lyase [Solemya velum gill symbiont]OOZ04651.1 aminodeoxychorismate lyase [Solemya velum gill symbiont]OOZ06891.1 aminodeoxychorismate lyase [Solemya velum gill symbiont]OOZ09073.1 aminodeoxychorismate lyase [Solemya velum gill symbiont]
MRLESHIHSPQQGGVFIALLVLLVVGAAAGYWLWHDYQRFQQAPLVLSDRGVNYRIEPGTTLTAIANDLADKGILRQPLYLRLLARERADANRIKAGEYHIPGGTTAVALLDQLVRGKVIEYSVTLIEGWNFQQVLSAVRTHPMIVQTLSESLSTEQLMEAIGLQGQHPEGQFYPDTYLFPRGTTDKEFLQRAYQSMQNILAEEWEQKDKDLPLETPYEALILASIIEKETVLPEERTEIAGVFTRRLEKGMLLQTDPTVIYGIDNFDGNIRRRDLKKDTPYNTYTRAGLPPTPIAMPGRDAIYAALHPADGKSLYFVATGNGGHYFSATLKEHNRAVNKYQIQRRKQRSE